MYNFKIKYRTTFKKSHFLVILQYNFFSMGIYAFDTNRKLHEEVEVLDEVEVEYSHQLIVYNDDVNTFDWVIESLMKICKHTLEQATQCAMFIHFKGKYAVQHGDELVLIPMKDALLDRGITAAIESCN